MRVSVLIIAINRLWRDAVAAFLNEQSDLTATTTGPAWEAVLPLALETRPQLIIVDSALGPQYIQHLLESMMATVPRIRVIVMDLLGAPEEVVEFVRAGCSGLILKDATLEDFLATLRAVAQGEAVLPQSLTETLFSYVVRRAGGREPNTVREAVMMTPREREVVALIAAGHSNKEIADRLHIAVHTVKCHVHAVLEKLALRSRLEIAAYAHRDLK